MSSPEQRHSLMQQARKPRSMLAGQEGLEPPTTGFGDRDSGQLSYCPLPDGPTGGAKPSAAAGSPARPPQPMRAWVVGAVNHRQLLKSTLPDARRRTAAHATCPGCHYGDMTSPHPRISARVSAIAESATLAVDTKAKALRAAGRPVIGFGAGEPNFPTPDYIVEAAQRACA